jgi:hypothetical protein
MYISIWGGMIQFTQSAQHMLLQGKPCYAQFRSFIITSNSGHL